MQIRDVLRITKGNVNAIEGYAIDICKCPVLAELCQINIDSQILIFQCVVKDYESNKGMFMRFERYEY